MGVIGRDEDCLSLPKGSDASRLSEKPKAIVLLPKENLNAIEVGLTLPMLSKGRGAIPRGAFPTLLMLRYPILKLSTRLTNVETTAPASDAVDDLGLLSEGQTVLRLAAESSADGVGGAGNEPHAYLTSLPLEGIEAGSREGDGEEEGRGFRGGRSREGPSFEEQSLAGLLNDPVDKG